MPSIDENLAFAPAYQLAGLIADKHNFLCGTHRTLSFAHGEAGRTAQRLSDSNA